MDLYRTPIGIIHDIKIGLDPKNGMSFRVGQEFRIGKDICEITEILRDDNSFFIFGVVRYIIWVRDTKTNEQFIWKTYESMPVSVTCKKQEDESA